MPTDGKIKHFRIKHSTLVAYNSTTLNVLKVDFGSISVGESWTGGAGVQTLLSSESPSAPTSGNHRYRNWDNLDTTFSAGDCLIITLNIGAAHGNIVGSLVIEYDFSGYD